MHIFKLLEARRQADLNVKVSAYSVIRDRYVGGDKDFYVSFTAINKLGNNPSSTYRTPLGIYSYPAWYVLKTVSPKTENMHELPFAGDQPYVNLFNVSGNIVDVSNMSESDCMEYFKKLHDLYQDIEVDKVISNSRTESRHSNIVGGRFWYVVREVARHLSGGKDKFGVKWNKAFRDLGIDGCIDNGIGIIHGIEPVQAVFFHKSVIRGVKSMDNKWEKYKTTDEHKISRQVASARDIAGQEYVPSKWEEYEDYYN